MGIESLMLPPTKAAVHKRAQKLIKSKKSVGKKRTATVEMVESLKKNDPDQMLSAALKELPSISKIRDKLDKSGRNVSIYQYFMMCFASAILATAFFKAVIGFGFGVSLILGLILGWIIPAKIVNRWIFKRMKKFLLIFPDALDLMVRGLRSGLPVTESINVIKEEIDEPVSEIFGEISSAIRMGVPFEEALYNTATKLNIQEFNFFVISIVMQRETGGNLAEILSNLSETIRARGIMKMKIRAISSEARMSSYIVGSLPFIVSLALIFVSPGYLDPLLADVKGNIALGVAATMFCVGMFTMRKMGSFEI